MSIPAWRWFLWSGLGATVVYFLLPDAERVTAGASALFHYTSAAAVLIGVRWHRPADRWPWYLLAAALLALGSVTRCCSSARSETWPTCSSSVPTSP